MSTSKDEEYFQTYLQHFDDDENDDQIENNRIIQTGTLNFYSDADGEVADNKSNIMVDGDGNYYYRSSEKIVKVEHLTKQIPVKESSVVFPSNETINKTQRVSVALKKSTRSANTKINVRAEGNNGNEGKKINSEIVNQVEVYDFDENEENPDDPPADVIDPDYKFKGVITEKKTTANEPSFSCTLCPYQSNKKFLLSRHIKTHSEERPFKCSVCERGFKTNTALSNHRNTHLGYKPHACSSCDMAFTTSGELVRHVRYRHTRIKPHKCTECDYSSVEMSKLRRHMRCHTGERPYQCPHCTYASPDTFKLKRHLRIHTGEKPYECDICHARFTQSNSLKHHRLIHSVNDKPVFQCHLCPTTCGRKTDLRLHIKKLHSSDQPLPCKRCGKELPDRYTYKMHMKTHEGEKCYRCEYCPYASISNRHLESHVLIHLDAKPFLCEICQSTFRQKALLSRHMKIYHLNNYEPPQPRKKDHKCPHCNKMFAFNGNLIRHMEIHDPTSRLHENKEELRMGRMRRVNPDGTVVTLASSNQLSKLLDGSEGSVYDESEEQQQQIDDVEIGEECEETEEYDVDNVHYVYDDYEADEYEEQFEEVQSHQQSDESSDRNKLTDVKQEFEKPLTTDKAEGDNDSKIMSLALQDDQGIMVIHVLADDEDDDDEEQQQDDEFQELEFQTIKPKTIIKTNNRSVLKESQRNVPSRISDYFGFEVNAEEEDEETEEAAQLLALMEQD